MSVPFTLPLAWKCADPCRRTTFLLERGFLLASMLVGGRVLSPILERTMALEATNRTAQLVQALYPIPRAAKFECLFAFTIAQRVRFAFLGGFGVAKSCRVRCAEFGGQPPPASHWAGGLVRAGGTDARLNRFLATALLPKPTC